MEEINEIQSYIVNGYVFETKTEYNEAVQEKKAIKYLSSKYETTVKQYESEKKKMKSRLSTSILFNIVLVAVVIAMFIITKNSDSPNILNYERVIQDKYSSWQSELNEKEQELKELEWKINHPEE